MAGQFVNASSQYIQNAGCPLPTTGYPFTIGCWVQPTSAGGGNNRTVWSFGDVTTTTNYFLLRRSGGGTWDLGSKAGGTEDTLSLATPTPTVGMWSFILCRCITATNRKMAGVRADGSIGNASASGSRAPTNLTTMCVGATAGSAFVDFSDSLIGEFWYTDADIQKDAANPIDNNLLRQLAFGGPFSVPSIVNSIVEYRSLRKMLTSDRDESSEIYARPGAQMWTQSGSQTVGPHCPLPYWYVKPGQDKVVLTI